MLSRKERKRLEERIEVLSIREDDILVRLSAIGETDTGLSGELTAELREVHKQLVETARVLSEGTPNWLEKAGDWGVRIAGVVIPSAIGYLGVRWQTNRLIESEDKMGILTSQASKKMQTPHLPK